MPAPPRRWTWPSRQALVAGERANIPASATSSNSELIGLGILVGQPPERVAVRPGTLTTLALPPVWPGLPSELLERRPDVASRRGAACRRRISDIKAARAAFFPDHPADRPARLCQRRRWTRCSRRAASLASLAAGLHRSRSSMAALLRGQLEQAKGRYDELLADYRKAVVQAFTDVETALTAWRYTTEQEALQQQAVDTARRAADIARAQMAAGTVDITTVLTTETTLFTDRGRAGPGPAGACSRRCWTSTRRWAAAGWSRPARCRTSSPGLQPGMLPGGDRAAGRRKRAMKTVSDNGCRAGSATAGYRGGNRMEAALIHGHRHT